MPRLGWVLLVLVGAGIIIGSLVLLKNDRLGTVVDQSATNPTPSSGKQVYHLEVGGEEREFVVYRPANLEPNAAVPVVFVFHGSGGSGPKFYEKTEWKTKADTEGFMVVYPTGLKYHVFDDEKVVHGVLKQNVAVYQTKFNSYEMPAALDPKYPEQVLADDVAFTDAMVSFLKDSYAVDSDKFYATGFSNGAQFTARLVVERSDVFAAFAPTSGGLLGPDVFTKAAASGLKITPRPVVQLVGELDPKLNHYAGVEGFDMTETATETSNPVFTAFISGYLAAGQLKDEHTYELTKLAAHYTYSESKIGAGNEYQLYIVKDMMHSYPPSAPELFWSFFKEYSL